MKQLLKKLLPISIAERLLLIRSMYEWRNRDYLDNSPQSVKQKVFKKYGIKDAIWVETGTYLGTTTDFLRQRYPHIHSIEPSAPLYKDALKRFNGKNVTLYNDVSEKVLPDLLPKLNGKINFWLDGHYSAGLTFKGESECPVEDELKAIEANFSNFDAMTILIDDVRYFLPKNDNYADYPSIDYLVDWARRHKCIWRIEHDIFIIQTGLIAD